jgi:FkbM family methyltransferase
VSYSAFQKTRHGLAIYPRNDRYVGRSLEVYGEYSEGEVDLFRSLLEPGDVVIEAGANVGALTLPLARLVGPRGLVHAFEPQRIPYYITCGTIALNGLDHVQVHLAAVGRDVGFITVPEFAFDLPGSYGGLELGPDADWRRDFAGRPVPVNTVSVVRLDAMFPQLGRLKLIKLDIEGMEKDALDGARELINRTRPFIYAEDRDDTLFDYLVRMGGYDVQRHETQLFNPENYFGHPEDVLGGASSHMVLGRPI